MSRMWFGAISLCTTPILTDLRRKPQKMPSEKRKSPLKNCNQRIAKRKQKNKHKIDQGIAKAKETCLYCAEPLLIKKKQGLSEGAMPHNRTDVLLLADVFKNFSWKGLPG